MLLFNCSSLNYIGHDCLSESTENPGIKLGLDLEHIDGFEYATFQGYKSLESIKVHSQFIKTDTFEKYINLKAI